MKKNKFIEDYLNYYCKLENPEYALLIKGPWGSGKTWFIRNYIESLKVKKGKVLYISLYGKTSFKEIEADLFQQLHPILSNKGMSIAGKVLKGALKTTLKIDLNNDSKDDLSINSQVPEIEIPDYLKNTEDCILVFDDLERCGIDLKNIMGYINHFIEHQELRVVIISNEEEIEKEALDGYTKTKEKIIGKTFEIKADFDNALNNFIKTISTQKAKAFLKKNRQTIKEIYDLSKYKNLRHLKQALWDFERLFKELPLKVNTNQTLLLQLLKLLLSFSFEIRKGKLHSKDLKDISTAYWIKFSKESKEEPATKFTKKYELIDFSNLILSEKCWIDFIDKGIIDKKLIKSSIESSIYYQHENIPEWKKLWHFRELKNEECLKVLETVKKEYDKKTFEDIGLFKHVVGLLLKMSEMGLLEDTKSSIIKSAKEYVQHMKNKGTLPEKEESLDFHNDAYDGLQFHGVGTQEFKKIVNYINKEIAKTNIEKLPQKGKELLKIMRKDTDKYSRMVYPCNYGEAAYCRIPVFKYIKPDEFINVFMNLGPNEKRLVVSSFEQRYQFNDPELLEELDWLKKITKLLKEKISKKEGVEEWVVSTFLIPVLENNIDKLNKAKKEKENSKN